MLDLKKIYELSAGVDEHLRKLESFTDELREIKYSLKELLHSQEAAYHHELQMIKKELRDVTGQLKKYGLPEINRYESDLQELREKINAPEWPLAVEPNHICTKDDASVKQRAESIVDMFVHQHFKGKRFLDYGCGNSQVVDIVKQKEPAFAIGYDVDLSKCKNATHCTTDFNHVKQHGPYDIVLVYDVLDHIVMIDPIQALFQIKEVLAHKGRVYLLAHPWCSRYGGHLYEQKNKAFLHLVFDDIELARIGGYNQEHNIRVVTPLETYRYWFAQAGFNIISEIPSRTKVEDFFLKPSTINDRIKKHWAQPDTMAAYMEIDYVEYVLEADRLNQQIL